MRGVKTTPMTTITVARRRPERGDHGDGEDDERKGEDRVDDPADDVVHEPAVVADDEAEDRAENGAEQRGERRDDEDVAGAGDDACEDVAADLVGAEPVRRVGPGEDALAGLVRVVRCQALTDYRTRDPKGENRDTDEEGPRADELVEELPPTGAEAGIECPRRRNEWILDRAHSAANRMRGFRRAYRRSATSVTTR